MALAMSGSKEEVQAEVRAEVQAVHERARAKVQAEQQQLPAPHDAEACFGYAKPVDLEDYPRKDAASDDGETAPRAVMDCALGEGPGTTQHASGSSTPAPEPSPEPPIIAAGSADIGGMAVA